MKTNTSFRALGLRTTLVAFMVGLCSTAFSQFSDSPVSLEEAITLATELKKEKKVTATTSNRVMRVMQGFVDNREQGHLIKAAYFDKVRARTINAQIASIDSTSAGLLRILYKTRFSIPAGMTDRQFWGALDKDIEIFYIRTGARIDKVFTPEDAEVFKMCPPDLVVALLDVARQPSFKYTKRFREPSPAATNAWRLYYNMSAFRMAKHSIIIRVLYREWLIPVPFKRELTSPTGKTYLVYMGHFFQDRQEPAMLEALFDNPYYGVMADKQHRKGMLASTYYNWD